MKPGIYANMPEEQYRAIDAINHSGLKEIAISPAKYQHVKRWGSRTTQALKIGRAVHESILEWDVFNTKYAEKKRVDGRTKEGIAYNKQWKKDNRGKEELLTLEYEMIYNLHKRWTESPQIQSIVGGEYWKEVTIIANDPSSGALCKGRFDVLTKSHVIVDIETTISADPKLFTKSIEKYNYHTQAAWYCMLYYWLFDRWPRGYYVAALEKGGPGDFSLHEFKKETLEMIYDAYCADWLKQYSTCRNNKAWPGYDHSAKVYEPSFWEMKKIESALGVESDSESNNHVDWS